MFKILNSKWDEISHFYIGGVQIGRSIAVNHG